MSVHNPASPLRDASVRRRHHMPNFGGADAQVCIDSQFERLLPVPYFFTTFTLLEQLHDRCLSPRKLFHVAPLASFGPIGWTWQTIETIV